MPKHAFKKTANPNFEALFAELPLPKHIKTESTQTLNQMFYACKNAQLSSIMLLFISLWSISAVTRQPWSWTGGQGQLC